MTGTLADTTPAGVLQVLSSQRSTGAVRFLGDSGCTVYLHQGELYFAENDDTAEDLAVALVRPGRLTAEEWDTATETGYPTETVGEALIETGSITRDLLASVVLSVIYDPLIALFQKPEGDYDFAPDVLHWVGPYRTFDVDAIVSEVRRRTREADEMIPMIPSLDAVVRSARTLPEEHGSVNLRRDDWEVVIAAAAGCTVNELAVELGRGRWSTARLVYRLATADLLMVTVDEGRSPSARDRAAVSPEPSFGLHASEAPPPLDDLTLTPEAEPTGTADPWSMDEPTETAREDSWSFDEPTTEPADPWSVDEPTAEATAEVDPWSLDEPLSGTEPADADAWSTDQAGGLTAEDPWGAPDGDETPADPWQAEEPAPDAPGSDALDADAWVDGLAAVPDLSESPAPDTAEGFDAPELHPDIAKALAESTYADSATAINAMAARLGAIDSDSDDSWDTGADDESGDDFWEPEAGSSDTEDFIWKPAVWDTGVESVPLPQREGTRTAAPQGADGAGDPAWLNNLYSEFMPGDPAAQNAGASGEDADKTPKQRGLRRLISAIRRL